MPLVYLYCIQSFTIYSKENRSFIGDHQQIIFEIFNRICLLILPSPFSPYIFPFQNLVKFQAIKNVHSTTFFTINNSSASDFVVQHFILSWIIVVSYLQKIAFYNKTFSYLKVLQEVYYLIFLLIFLKTFPASTYFLESIMETLMCEICETCMKTNV